jgi:hypothetical protein
MSAIKNLSTMPIAKLLQLKSQYDAEIQSRGSSGATPAAPKKKRAGSERGTAWASFTKMVTTVHAADFAAFKEATAVKQGIAPKFVAHYRSTHEGEWEAYNETWKAEHPKSSEGSVEEDEEAEPVAAVSVAQAPAKKRGPKKLSDMTPEELADRAAKKAAKKDAPSAATEAAAKAEAPVTVVPAPVPVVAVSMAALATEEDEEAEVELLPFKLDGQTYIRPKSGDDWASGDLWYANADGSKGSYFGELMEDGSINTDAEEPSFD